MIKKVIFLVHLCFALQAIIVEGKNFQIIVHAFIVILVKSAAINRILLKPNSSRLNKLHIAGDEAKHKCVLGTVLRFSCDKGYFFAGSSTIKCVENADGNYVWNHPAPSCTSKNKVIKVKSTQWNLVEQFKESK